MQKYVWSGTIIYNQVLFLLQKGHLAQKNLASKHILQHLKRPIIIVNRFNYMNDKVTRRRKVIILDPEITLGLYTLNMQANVDHHGPFMHCDHVMLLPIGAENVLFQR